MNSEPKVEEKSSEGQNNQEIINEILSKRSKTQRKSWFGQDKDKDIIHKSTQEFSNTEIIVEEDQTNEKK